MIFYLYIYLLMILMLLSLNLFLYLYINKMSLFFEFELMNFFSMKIEFLLMFDWMNMLFLSVILIISMMVVFYSIEYMYFDLGNQRFMMMIMLFVLSMMLMILSPNLISILFGWDGLGLVSYCLIVYYQNKSSLNSGMITVLTNRLGDIMILMMISLVISIGSWNFMFFNKISNLMMMLILIAAFTKSAQIPFSYWLPMAMAAPTPVSSLVHSSTLVTAGVYLLIRFNYLMNNLLILKLMFILSIFTLLISSMMAIMEFDLKKIIAYSTLSQLSLMIFCLSLKLINFSFFHLLTHAMFKSMLFLCSGIMIHNSFNMNQDIRKLSLMLMFMPVVNMMFNCSIFSLCGIPFMSGFFSKDLILELFLMSKFNFFIFMILFISMGLTFSYSIRLIYYSLFNLSQINLYKINFFLFKTKMVLSMYMLFFFSIIFGSLLNWMMFSGKNLIYIQMNFKLLIYYFMIFSLFMILIFIMKKMKLKLKKNNMNFLFNMWFMYNLFNLNYFKTLKITNDYIVYTEKTWGEYITWMWMKNLMHKMKKYDIINENFMYLFILLTYLLLLLIFIL
nr:NADH deshydrogenase subunit 5 [Euceros serricornis]